MAWRVTFATLPTGNEALSALDQAFNDVGLLTVVPCVATGTNTIALAPFSNTATQSAYTDNQRYSFIAAANSTGPVTVNVNSLGALPLYRWSGSNTYVQADAGDLFLNGYYDIAYVSGSGGFIIVSAIGIDTSLDKIGSTQGDILYRGASGWAALGPGTSGQFFQTQGAAANPQWASGLSGGLTLISAQSASNSASIAFTGLGSTYRTLWLDFDSVLMQTAAQKLLLQMGTGGGPTYDTTAADYYSQAVYINSNSQAATDTSASAGVVIAGLSGENPDATHVIFGQFEFGDVTQGTARIRFNGKSCYDTASYHTQSNVSGYWSPSAAVSAVRIIPSSGNIVSGNFRLFGIQKS